MSDSTNSGNTVMIERTFEASIDLVWQMWTQPEHYQRWYGPRGFSVPVAKMDVRVGGKRLVCMEGETPRGPMKMWTAGEYVEVSPVTRLVFTEGMADENGNVLSPAAMGMGEGFPETTIVTVELEDLGGRTKMVMTQTGLPGGDGASNGAKAAWGQAFEKMAELLPALLTGS